MTQAQPLPEMPAPRGVNELPGSRANPMGWRAELPGQQHSRLGAKPCSREGRHLCAGLLATPGKHLHTHCCLLPAPSPSPGGGQEGLLDRLSDLRSCFHRPGSCFARACGLVTTCTFPTCAPPTLGHSWTCWPPQPCAWGGLPCVTYLTLERGTELLLRCITAHWLSWAPRRQQAPSTQ